MSHTPGPWKSDTFVVTAPHQHGKSFWGTREICHTGEGRGESKESEANARLIALAPDHAIVARLLASKKMRWENGSTNWNRGLYFEDKRYPTELDEFGVPKLTEALRAAIQAVEESYDTRRSP
jgi:hypothetical protein